MSEGKVPVDFSDPINARILAVSEDQLQGFQEDPIGEIVRQSGVEAPVVIERIRAMLRAGAIRRVRQTLLATNLARARSWLGRCRRSGWTRHSTTCSRRIHFPGMS